MNFPLFSLSSLEDFSKFYASFLSRWLIQGEVPFCTSGSWGLTWRHLRTPGYAGGREGLQDHRPHPFNREDWRYPQEICSLSLSLSCFFSLSLISWIVLRPNPPILRETCNDPNIIAILTMSSGKVLQERGAFFRSSERVVCLLQQLFCGLGGLRFLSNQTPTWPRLDSLVATHCSLLTPTLVTLSAAQKRENCSKPLIHLKT